MIGIGEELVMGCRCGLGSNPTTVGMGEELAMGCFGLCSKTIRVAGEELLMDF
jgi:hypothetical protein